MQKKTSNPSVALDSLNQTTSSLIDSIRAQGQSANEAVPLLQQTAIQLFGADRLHDAEVLLLASRELAEQAFGAVHWQVARANFWLGQICQEQERWEEAVVLYRRALATAEQEQDPENALVCLLRLGRVADAPEAVRFLRRLLALPEQHPELLLARRWEVGRANFFLGKLRQEQGDRQEADVLYRRALVVAEQEQDLEDIASCLLRLADLSFHPAAEQFVQQLLALQKQHPDLPIAKRSTVLDALLRARLYVAPSQELIDLYEGIVDALLAEAADPEELVPYLYKMACRLDCCQQPARAEALFARTLALGETCLPADACELHGSRLALLARRARREQAEATRNAIDAQLTDAFRRYLAHGKDPAGALDHYDVYAVLMAPDTAEVLLEIRLRPGVVYCCGDFECHLGVFCPPFNIRPSLAEVGLEALPPLLIHTRWVVEEGSQGGGRSTDRQGNPVPHSPLRPHVGDQLGPYPEGGRDDMSRNGVAERATLP